MSIKEKSNEFLRILSIVSNQNIQNKISGERIRKLLGISKIDFIGVIEYLKDKERIKLINSNNDVSITSTGIDTVEELKIGKKYIIVGFLKGEYMPSSRDGTDYIFYYNIIKEDGTISERNRIKVGISGSLVMQWSHQLPNHNIYEGVTLVKILFQYAKNTVFEKLKEGTLNQYEEMTLLSGMYGDCLYKNIDDLIEPVNLIYEIEVGVKIEINNVEELIKDILDKREGINSKFKSAHKKKLFTPVKEHDLFSIFKDVNSKEEFGERVNALSNICQSMDENLLQSIVKKFNPTDKSITLLEKYLKENTSTDNDIAKIMRCIVSIRNGIHHTNSDEHGKVLESYIYFNESFPIKNYNEFWKKLLSQYNKSLDQLNIIITKLYIG